MRTNKHSLDMADLSISAEGILDTLSDTLMVVDIDANILWANLAAEHLFILSRKRLIQSNLTELMGKDHPILGLLEQTTPKASTIARDIEFTASHRHQKHRVDVQIMPLTEAHYIVTIRPLMSNQAQLWQKNMQHPQPIDFMRSVLSHELRNPLAGIRGAAQLLSMDLSEDQKDLTHIILDETDRINRFIETLNMVDVPESEYKAFNIHKALNTAIRNIKTQWPNVQILEQFDPSLPEIYGHEDSLVRAFLNLARNSVEALNEIEHKCITFRTYWRQDVHLKYSYNKGFQALLPIIVEIEDNGAGIADDMVDDIFKPFVSSKKNSRGLGLALTEKTIHDHQAVISCASHPGKTRFTIKFPTYRNQNSKELS